MKKILSLILVLSFLLICVCSCGKMSERIDGKLFTFSYAQDSLHVLACAASKSSEYPNAEVMDYTLKAQDGQLTVIGAEGAYTGTYTMYKVLKDHVLYTVSIGEYMGHASMTKHVSGDTVEYTLLLSLNGYTLSFTSGKIAK